MPSRRCICEVWKEESIVISLGVCSVQYYFYENKEFSTETEVYLFLKQILD